MEVFMIFYVIFIILLLFLALTQEPKSRTHNILLEIIKMLILIPIAIFISYLLAHIIIEIIKNQ